MHHLFRNTVLFALLALSAFSKEEYTSKAFNQSVVLELLNSGDRAIVQVEESGKVFLRPTVIFPTERGLFIKTECGDYVQIPFLVSSEQGCYTVLTPTDSTIYPIIRCKKCDLPFNPNIFNLGRCPRCGTQN